MLRLLTDRSPEAFLDVLERARALSADEAETDARTEEAEAELETV